MAAKAALRAGLTWAQFWGSIPYQTKIVGEAWVENRKLDRNLVLTGAYLTARLGMVDAKKFPKLEEFLGEEAKRDVGQTPDEFATAFLQFAIKHGLDVSDGSND